jgi:hypothetical protein
MTRRPRLTTIEPQALRNPQLSASSDHPAPRLSPHLHLREDHEGIAPERFDNVEELQDVETALSLLVR